MAYTSSQVVQAVPTGINSALVFIAKTDHTVAAASLAMTNVFSSTYDNYLVLVTKLKASANSGEGRVRFGTSGTADSGANYNYSAVTASNGSVGAQNYTSETHFKMLGSYIGTIDPSAFVIHVNNPNKAYITTITTNNYGDPDTVQGSEAGGGRVNTTTQYTDFFLGVQNTSTQTHTAEIAIYGYTNS